MPTKFANYMTHLSRISCLLFFLITPTLSFGFPKLKPIPLNRDFINLPDGRWIWLPKIDWHSSEIILGTGKKSRKNKIWSVVKNDTDDGGTWDYAYFIFFKPGVLSTDLNNDGNPEVAIATYDNGRLVEREVLIYTVKPHSVEFFKEEGPYNLEFDLPLYEREEPVF